MSMVKVAPPEYARANLTSGDAGDIVDGSSVERFGRVVVLKCRVTKCTLQKNIETTIAHVPDGFRPSNIIYGSAGTTDNATTRYAFVDRGGNVVVSTYTDADSRQFMVNLVWMLS